MLFSRDWNRDHSCGSIYKLYSKLLARASDYLKACIAVTFITPATDIRLFTSSSSSRINENGRLFSNEPDL